jgi:hypothetical protein
VAASTRVRKSGDEEMCATDPLFLSGGLVNDSADHLLLTCQIARRAGGTVDPLLFVTTHAGDAAEQMPARAGMFKEVGRVRLSDDRSEVELSAAGRVWRCSAADNFAEAAQLQKQVTVLVGYDRRPRDMDANLYFDQINRKSAFSLFRLPLDP